LKKDVRFQRILEKARSGSKNVTFREMVYLMKALGFSLARVNGSHHIFARPGLRELVNLQVVSGMAKPHQVKQFIRLVDRYRLQPGDSK
jgi:predicted RNA binding protein YcfA (HicA-like mRNA interferase family)